MPDTAQIALRRDDLAMPSPYVAPQTEIEKLITATFEKVFQIDQVGMDDEFYDLGGDSLTGEELGIELSEKLGITFPISRLFDEGSPRKIVQAMGQDRLAETQELSRPPVFMVHGVSGHTVPRPAFYEGLAKDQRLVIFELPGIRADQPVPHRIEGVAAAYVAQIQKELPEGPIHLAAFCAGWLIAMEMARQLSEIGRPVAHMVLLDPVYPSELTARLRGMRGPLAARLVTLALRGRATGGASKEDFEDNGLLELRAKVMGLEHGAYKHRNRILRRNTGKPRPQRFDDRAKSKLKAYFRHYWPSPFTGSAEVLVSRERLPRFEGPNAIVRVMLPNAPVRVAAERHDDVTGASGPEVARAMQASFDAHQQG